MSKTPQQLKLCILKPQLFTQVPSLPKREHKLIIKNLVIVITINWIILKILLEKLFVVLEEKFLFTEEWDFFFPKELYENVVINNVT